MVVATAFPPGSGGGERGCQRLFAAREKEIQGFGLGREGGCTVLIGHAHQNIGMNTHQEGAHDWKKRADDTSLKQLFSSTDHCRSTPRTGILVGLCFGGDEDGLGHVNLWWWGSEGRSTVQNEVGRVATMLPKPCNTQIQRGVPTWLVKP